MPHPKQGYILKSGEKVPGTTTIISRFKESGGLLYWAFEQGKLAQQGKISSLYDNRDKAADAGTLAHEMVESHIKGEPLPEIKASKEIQRQAEQGFQNYLKWSDNNRIRVIKQEILLVSEKYKYGGCPDAVGLDNDDNLCLLDWKTSNAVYADYIIQLSAYANLWEENFPEQKIIGGYHILRFSKEQADFSHHFFNDVSDGWKMFKLYRKAFDLDKKLKKRV